MKALFNVLLFVFTAFLFTQCEKEPDPNNTVDIPDTAFLNVLIEEGVDSNGDSLICYCEAEATESLIIHVRDIHDMKGIEAFINLDTLICSTNNITSLDVSELKNLSVLYCGGNKLSVLDISNNTELKELGCGGLALPIYGHMGAYNRNIFENLDLTQNVKLEILSCSRCYLDSLDVSNNTALKELDCWGNQLINLDVSSHDSLVFLNIMEMPSLEEVCVWTTPFPPEGVDVIYESSPNVTFTTECSK